MRTADEWLADYGASHQQLANKRLHVICVPLIVFALLGLLRALPVPAAFADHAPYFSWALPVAAALLGYYARLSERLALGMLLPLAVALWALERLAAVAPPLWPICVAIFALGWLGQFVGHALERRRPSFFDDLQFLLIAPLWLLSAVYQRLGLRY